MATHKFGKLSFDTSKDGLSFRFGDGRTHRLGLGKRDSDAPSEYDENTYENGAYPEDVYDDGYYAEDASAQTGSREPTGYRGRFAAPENESDGDYADGGYADDDRYADDGGYADDDRYADDGGYADDDRYADDGGYDDGYEAGSYDDRYSDADAQGEYEEAYPEESGLMRYVDENDWVTYVLLFLLPPLGIYLLWRRRRFEAPLRWAVTIASAVWFVILLMLIISAIRSGSNDQTVTGPLTITTPTPTVGADTSFTAVDSDGSAVTSADLTVSSADSLLDSLTPDATAIPSDVSSAGTGAATSAITGTETVYMTATGTYFHRNPTCSGIEPGALVSTVTESVATARGKAPCPICFVDQTMVWATAKGQYYHTTATCSGMTDATQMTESAAKAAGKTACPVCITHTIGSLSKSGLKFANKNTTDKSGITVYATKDGSYFHTSSTCSGMTNAVSGSLLKAMLAGKTACPKCCASAARIVYCTKNGTYYHSKANCSNMEGAVPVTLAEAMVLGKKSCKTCIGSGGAAVTADGVTTDLTKASGTVYVYGTKNGKYYHTNSSCSGMQGATRYTLKSMVLAGRKPCPDCCKGANTTVYAADGGKYYHSFATCSGMKNGKKGTLAEALAYGFKRCPDCWTSSGGKNTENADTMVYCTKDGTYYHTKKNCSGMKDAVQVTISKAVKNGKKACPTCASGAKSTVYSTKTGKYYHTYATCSGMAHAVARSVEEAKTLGQTACPVCIGSSKKSSEKEEEEKEKETEKEDKVDKELKTISKKEFMQQVEKSNLTSSGKYKSGASGIKVYASVKGKYYHVSLTCAGSNAGKVTLEVALNYGKTACPKCAASANTKVYMVKGSKYYHYSKTCAGSGAASGARSVALAKGAEPCPYCVTKTKTPSKNSHTYKVGKSGIKVYASLAGKYYHTSRSCAGAGASTVALETALNYGKSACPSCAASAKKTVYADAKGKYYHSSKACAGSGATSGQFAKALALGLKKCPVCISGSEAYEVSDVKYSAPGDTGVFIDLESDTLYYHRAKKCSSAHMGDSQRVALEFALKWGFVACPYCTPPTSIK